MPNDPLVVSLKSSRRSMPEPEEREPLPPAPPPNIRRRRRGYGGMFILLFVILAIVASLLWYVDPFGDDTSNAQNPGKIEEETEDLITAVGELIVLPEGEEPTIATVTDPSKLRDQVFFSNAKTGDKVLIYTKARKAILYDPKANKLLEVAPLTVEPQ